jgi:hypothetical protein
MKPQYQHELMTSFLLWFDHELLQKGEAYSNKSGQLYLQSDSRLPDNLLRYSSNFKQWVNDSSISGTPNPIIPTTVYIYDDGVGDIPADVTRNNASYSIDFDNGGIVASTGILNTSLDPTEAAKKLGISGTFAVKDFNVYLTNETEEDLIIENKFKLNSRYDQQPSGIEPYDQAVPAIFINSEFMTNEGFAFGGEDKTNNIIKAVVIAENDYQLDGALSIFADSARKVIPKIPFTGHPVTERGDIKGPEIEISPSVFAPVYNYNALAASYTDRPFFIDDVTVSKFSDRAQSKIPGDLKIGFIDFDVSTTRFPRS